MNRISDSATPVARTAVLPVDLGSGPFAVTTSDLVKRYGEVAALSGLNLQIPEGAVYVLVGPNGAGKTTLLRILMNFLRAEDGEISLFGHDPRATRGAARAQIGYVPEGHDVGYPWMTIGRLLEHHAIYYGTWDPAYANRLVNAYDVDPSRRCGALSKGQRRRVQLILALAHRPRVLLLDEPTDGLDHVVRDRTLEILSEHLSDSPTTVLVSTHRVYEIERLVDHVGVLAHGRLLGQLPRITLERNLRRYWAEVPEGWTASPGLAARVIRRSGRGRDIEWTVWGEEDEVRHAFTGSGVTVRDVGVLPVDDAATALLTREETS